MKKPSRLECERCGFRATKRVLLQHRYSEECDILEEFKVRGFKRMVHPSAALMLERAGLPVDEVIIGASKQYFAPEFAVRIWELLRGHKNTDPALRLMLARRLWSDRRAVDYFELLKRLDPSAASPDEIYCYLFTSGPRPFGP